MFPNKKFRRVFYIFFFMLAAQSQAQDYSFLPKTIRTNIEYQNRGEYEAALDFNLRSLKSYKEKKDPEGIATVYTNMGNMLFILSKYKESLRYLDRAKGELIENNNPLLNGRLYIEYGKNYTSLGLFKQSNAMFDKALQYINKIPNQKQKIYYLNANYSWKRINFLELRQMDSLRSIEKKSLQLKSNILVYTRKADYFIANKIHLDSAEYYLNKALSNNTATDTIDMAVTWFSYGDLHTVKKDHQKALEYYLKSLKVLEKIKQNESVIVAYDSISNAYKALNDTQKSNEYLRKYSDLNNKIKKEEKAAVNVVVDKLLQEEKKEKEEEGRRLYLLVAIIVIVSLILIYFIRKAYLSKQKKKDQLIEKQSQETQKLKVQVNKSFDQIVELAESGSPFFLTRFKEVYHEFYEKLNSHHSDLTDYDLRLCAYIRLNLNAKEIAQYENITLRAVEARKYRLKKKLELPSETDLTKWILDL
ncbi:tetratricopeptide repeat protein [Chryseobacterium sp. JUb7]|uniref:tetratricopeptide repeat protein n=1 Tax=Chryseobacterium sp. JUb7 TaxID=2940599 RepID=UPI00216803D2|nr:tetratricopeptide repeat protein [Chryseobacterium sp. JUb7]MCS3532823.1 tetratricopeptide (TPR) repeat protein [Chryseobacterium sp. JUb7]